MTFLDCQCCLSVTTYHFHYKTLQENWSLVITFHSNDIKVVTDWGPLVTTLQVVTTALWEATHQ